MLRTVLRGGESREAQTLPASVEERSSARPLTTQNATYNNQFLTVEGFHHKADAIDFAQEAYKADTEGMISLISEV